MEKNQENQNEELLIEQPDQNGKKSLGYGKIFLITAVLIVQAAGAFVVVQKNYPVLYSFANSFNSTGGYYFQLDNIVINPKNSHGQRYLLISLAFEFYSSKDLSKAERMNVELLDQVNLLLIQKTTNELSSLEFRDEIKSELIREMNERFDRKVVRNLFFTKYVIQ